MKRAAVVLTIALLTGCGVMETGDPHLKAKCQAGNKVACDQYQLSKQDDTRNEEGISSYCDHGNRVYVKRQTDHNGFGRDSITAVHDPSCPQDQPSPIRTPG